MQEKARNKMLLQCIGDNVGDYFLCDCEQQQITQQSGMFRRQFA
jgi:hypothetical protein